MQIRKTNRINHLARGYGYVRHTTAPRDLHYLRRASSALHAPAWGPEP